MLLQNYTELSVADTDADADADDAEEDDAPEAVVPVLLLPLAVVPDSVRPSLETSFFKLPKVNNMKVAGKISVIKHPAKLKPMFSRRAPVMIKMNKQFSKKAKLQIRATRKVFFVISALCAILIILTPKNTKPIAITSEKNEITVE